MDTLCQRLHPPGTRDHPYSDSPHSPISESREILVSRLRAKPPRSACLQLLAHEGGHVSHLVDSLRSKKNDDFMVDHDFLIWGVGRTSTAGEPEQKI